MSRPFARPTFLLLALAVLVTYVSVQAYFLSTTNNRKLSLSNSYRRAGRLYMVEPGPYKGPDSTPLLDTVQSPVDLKRFDIKQLKQLSHELRWETINAVSKTGGHLGSSLGVVELTVALHYVFNAPEDKIVWDVAHQAYPHKIITGRRSRMSTLRQLHGLSGFTNRNESEYDCFGAGLSSFLRFTLTCMTTRPFPCRA